MVDERFTTMAPPRGEFDPFGGVLVDVPPRYLALALTLGVGWAAVFATATLFALDLIPPPPLAANIIAGLVLAYFLGHTVRCLRGVFERASQVEPPRRVWTGFHAPSDGRAAIDGLLGLVLGPGILMCVGIWYWFETGSTHPFDVLAQLQLLSIGFGWWLVTILSGTIWPPGMWRWLRQFDWPTLWIFIGAVLFEGLVVWVMMASVEVFAGIVPLGIVFRFLISTTLFLPLVLIVHLMGTRRRGD